MRTMITATSSARPHRTLAALALVVSGTAPAVLLAAPAGAVSPPLAPSNLAVETTPSASNVVTWADNSSDETGFEIERCANTSTIDATGQLVVGGCTVDADFVSRASVPAGTTVLTDPAFGTFTYRVRAIGALGASAWTVPVRNPLTRTVPVARITSPTSAAVSVSLAFDGTASTVAAGAIIAWEWSFGDGATATGATASHAYAAAGTYPVVLTVTDAAGATASARASITVAAAPLVAPSKPKAASTVKRRVDLTWTMPKTANPTSITVLRCTGSTCTFFGHAATLPGTARSYRDTTVASGTAYRYVIVAQYPAGTASSSIVSAKAR